MISCNDIFAIDDDKFEKVALSIFDYQYQNNDVYRTFCNLLKKNPNNCRDLKSIPFIPISFFKTHKVFCGKSSHKAVFHSSGTTLSTPSKHYIKDLELYKESFYKAFSLFYGFPNDYTFLSLVPDKRNTQNSSLLTMINSFIEHSDFEESGCYVGKEKALINILKILNTEKKKCILFGLSYALLDFAEKYTLDIPNIIVMETGGLKGQRKEMTKEELHKKLKLAFNVEYIHSEYSMTELLSQAYSKSEGKFSYPPWMKVFIREPEDPISFLEENRYGGINIIDLVNIHSCSFIETEDLGRKFSDNTFEVIGRFDNSDIRGCNLLYGDYVKPNT